MPLVTAIFAADGTEVFSAYQKVATEGDAFRFVSAEPGKEVIRHLSERTDSVAGTPSSYGFNTGFNYLVGVKQLQVAAVCNNGVEVPLTRLSTLTEARERVDEAGSPTWTSADIDPALGTTYYWAEETSDTIRVYNIVEGSTSFHGSLVKAIRIWAPHTATPGELQERLSIRNQSDNVAIELLGDGDGIRLRSRNGVAYTLRIGDNGTFIVEAS